MPLPLTFLFASTSATNLFVSVYAFVPSQTLEVSAVVVSPSVAFQLSPTARVVVKVASVALSLKVNVVSYVTSIAITFDLTEAPIAMLKNRNNDKNIE